MEISKLLETLLILNTLISKVVFYVLFLFWFGEELLRLSSGYPPFLSIIGVMGLMAFITPDIKEFFEKK